jgi:hypothetical protein
MSPGSRPSGNKMNMSWPECRMTSANLTTPGSQGHGKVVKWGCELLFHSSG